MISIILGNDTVKSREAFNVLKKEHTEKGSEIYNLTSDSLSEMGKWLGESQGLFQTKKVFFSENILSKKDHREKLKNYDTKDKGIEIIIWEEKIEDKAAKFFFTNASLISFNLPTTIFKYLDALYPSNLKQINGYLTEIATTVDDNIIFYMTAKRIRELFLAKIGESPGAKLASWQISKLKSQANFWQESKLQNCYDALYRIEVQNKTSANYYTLKEALDMLFCYFVI